MLLFYIRHGDPIYDPDSLTPLGSRQAEAVARRLALYGLDRIYSSSSNRAKLTAQPTCELLKTDMEILDWTNEHYAWLEFSRIDPASGNRVWDFCLPWLREIYASPEIAALGEHWYDHPQVRDEGFREGDARIRRETYAFLAELGYVFDPEKGMYRAERPNGERIALFAHQGFGLAFLSRLLNIPRPVFCTRFDMGHSGLTVIEFPETEGWVLPRILTLSNDSHLYRDGLPTRYQNRIYF